jgi:hypothetical protein
LATADREAVTDGPLGLWAPKQHAQMGKSVLCDFCLVLICRKACFVEPAKNAG